MAGDLAEMVERAVERYNRYRSPEAVARLVKVSGERALVEFRGAFCRSCGVYDWLEDLIYELKGVYPEYDGKIVWWKKVSEDTILAELKIRIS